MVSITIYIDMYRYIDIINVYIYIYIYIYIVMLFVLCETIVCFQTSALTADLPLSQNQFC